MKLYTFVFRSYYLVDIKQIASKKSSDEVKRTYLNSFYECVSEFTLSEDEKIPENIYLFEMEIHPEDLSPSI